MTLKNIWLAIGFTGQLCFTIRFLVQWIASERLKKSVIPNAFWAFSLAGGTILLSYSIYKKDPVFIVGQSTGIFIYLRNMYLIRKERARIRLEGGRTHPVPGDSLA